MAAAKSTDDSATFVPSKDSEEAELIQRIQLKLDGRSVASGSADVEELNARIEKALNEFLEEDKVIEVMGGVGVVQTRNIVEEMRKNCHSKMERMLLNDMMLTYLKE